jgi:pullulanase
MMKSILKIVIISVVNILITGCTLSTSSSANPTSNVSTNTNIQTINFRIRSDEPTDYSNYALWIWEDGYNGALFIFEDTDDYGGLLSFPVDFWNTRTKLNYIIRPATSWIGQTPDTKILYEDFLPYVNDAGEMNVYLILGESEYYFTREEALGDRITQSYFTDWNKIQINATAPFSKYEILKDDVIIVSSSNGTPGMIVSLTSEAELMSVYKIRVQFLSTVNKLKTRTVLMNRLFDTQKFIDEYTYTGNDLGLTLTSTTATFKVWAPTTSSIRLLIYDRGHAVDTPLLPGQPNPNTFIGWREMTREAKGVYATTLALTDYNGLIGKYYTYRILNSLGRSEVVDPYAKSAGLNGTRGMIIDMEATNPTGWNQMQFEDITSPTDLLVYELHVRDLTRDVTWTGSEANRGKFKGLIEPGTRYTSPQGVTVTTGFDHLKELGFNALQILPFYDQANEETSETFNWGYNPLNFNVLEGQYSSDPTDGSVRVKEFKEVVKTFANNGVRIIKDVVYNHVASATGSNFNQIVPGYYFRLNPDGTYSDGAGVGNETKSERPMFRKFIVDSITFWAREYKIKGFRFDLMALIDVETMNLVRSELSKIDPDIVIYGEPWKGFTDTTLPLEQQSNTFSVYNRLNGIGGFNDAGRNGLKGENNWGNGTEYGWFQKGENDNAANSNFINRVKGMLAGVNGDYYSSTYRDPQKTINYASAHDNLTLYDQLQGTVGVSDAPNASVGINALVSFSAGVPFIHAGEEIMRTKIAEASDEDQYVFVINGQRISHNSYKSSDFTNSFKWDRKVTYLAQFERYKEMFRLRLNGLAFQLEQSSLVETRLGFWEDPLTYSTIAMWLTNDPNNAYYVFANARETRTTGTLTSMIRWGTSSDAVEVLFDSTGYYPIGTTLNGQVTMQPYQVLFLKR